MEQVFLAILNMSIMASWLALAVIILRFFLKKVPKSFVVVMWALVGIRLVCPFFVESELSLLPRFGTISSAVFDSEDFTEGNGTTSEFGGNQEIPNRPSANTQIGDISNSGSNAEKVPSQNPGSSNTGTQAGVNSGQSNIIKPVQGTNTNTDVGEQGNISPKESFLKKFVPIGSGIWLAGMLIMFAYSIITYLRLHHKVSISLCTEKAVYLCDEIDTPFVLGIIRPRIYVPSGMETEQIRYVIEHERAHLQRKDHWWKPIGFTLLAIHWFNPVMWLAYILLCRDIELACDEKVIKNMNNLDKKGYSETLLACSIPRRMILVCPLAFGEVGVKERVKFMKQYKKPAFWILVVGVVACVVLAVGFLTNPKEEIKHFRVMYNDKIYEKVDEKIPVHSYIYVGEIASVTEEETPDKNFQSTEELVGYRIYETFGTSDYVFVKKDGAYITCKDISVTEESSFDNEEISEEELTSIENYIVDYLEGYVPSENEALNDLVATVPDHQVYLDATQNKVSVTVIKCTEEKMALFKEYILDSQAVVFENYSVEMFNLPTTQEKNVDWGLTLSVENVTSTGLTLVYQHAKDDFQGELLTGGRYHLCVKENGIWKNVEYIDVLAWTDMGYGISTNKETRQEVNWSFSYGNLQPGEYKIGKEVDMKKSESSEWESAYFFAEFSVYTDKPSITVEAELVPYPLESHPIYQNGFYAEITEENATPIYKIENIEVLEVLKEVLFANSLNLDEDENVSSFEEATANMDEAYFEEYTLFVLYIRSNSRSWEYGVTNIEEVGTLLKIEVSQINHPETLEEGDVGRMILVSLDKEMVALPKNFSGYFCNKYYYQDKITAVTEGTIRLGEVQAPNLFYPYRNLNVGDEITVVYDGSMKTTSSKSFGKVYEIFFVDEYGTTRTAFPQQNEYGLSLWVENVTPTGLTLTWSQSGVQLANELMSGVSYNTLEVNTGYGWKTVEPLVAVGNLSIGVPIGMNETMSYDINWEEEYGVLEPGFYRIGKEVTVLSTDGNWKNDKKIMLYAEFMIR